MKSLAIVLMATLAAIGYGILHDQLTARICVESFGAGHAPAIDPHDPRQVALVRGVLATWWMGALLGCLIAVAARAGGRPKLGPLGLVLPMGGTLLASAVSGVVGGSIGAWLAEKGVIALAGELAELVPESEHVDYLSNLWASCGSYLGSGLAGVAVVARTWKRRGRMRKASRPRPRERADRPRPDPR